MINFRFITNLLGRLLLLESAFLFLCIIVAFIYKGPDLMAFVYTTAITLTSGGAICRFVKIKDRVLAKKDGYFMVTTVWIVFSLFGCLPYIWGNTLPSFTDAFFETMSGFTTTGSSVIPDIESVPHATLFWRSLTHWLGGVGIIMLFIAVLPSLGIEGRDLYVAETTGPTHNKTSFTFTGSARKIWLLYVILTLIQSVLLYAGGMNTFDSICHTMSTISTGGFSTKANSIAHWNSPYIQYVIITFMFISGTNFGLLYGIFQGYWRKLYTDNEFRFYTTITIVASIIIGTGLYFSGWADTEKSFRDALFQVVSIMTTTGFATVDYLQWSPLLGLILFLLFFTGACAGTTAGGFKMIRVYLLFKNSFTELKRLIHPNGVIMVKYNHKSVHPNIMTGVMGFAILYIIIFVLGSLVMALFADDMLTACSSVISSMSNVGPGFGSIGPMYTYAPFNEFAKLFLSFLMLVGRLEIFTVMVLFTPSFWKR